MPIEGIGIIGANKRSFLLSRLLIEKGFQVRVYDSFKDSLNILMSKLRWVFLKENKEELLMNIEAIQDYSKFRGADLIIETTIKTPEERFLYFSKIIKEVEDNCIFAVNSSIPIINSIEKISILPIEKTVGINFPEVFSNIILEVSKTRYTNVDVIENMESFLDKLGIKYSIINDIPGGIFERLTRVYINSAFTTLYKGKGFPYEIDNAIKELTFSNYGPFEYLDIIGIDYDYNTGLRLYEMLKRESIKPTEIELKLLQYGQLGKKSNLGVYIYEDGNIAGENPILPAIIQYLGLRKVNKTEIFSDIMIPVFNEATEISKEIMIGEQDIENITKYTFGWSNGIFSLQKKYSELFVVKEKTEFDNLDTF